MMPPTSRALDEALPTLAHAVDRHAQIERAARDGADGGVHAGGVTTTRKDSDMFHKSEIMARPVASPPGLPIFPGKSQ
jgi:hypothetical protein